MKANWLSIIPLSLAMLLVSGCSDDSDQGALKQYNEASQVMDAAQAEQSPISCALLVARTIEDSTERSKAMASIAGTQAEAGQRERALQLLSEAREVARIKPWPNLRLLCAIAGKYAEAGQQEQASRILAETLITAQTINRIYDDIKQTGLWVVPDIAIQYAKIGEFDQALETADRIKKPARDRIRAWIGIAAEYAKAGKNERALQLLPQALEEAKTYEDKELQPGVLSEFAVNYAKVGDFDQALEMARKINNSNSNTRYQILATIGVRYAEIGQQEQAMKPSR